MIPDQHNAILSLLKKIQKLILIVSSISVVSLMMAIVIMRYFLKIDLLGMDEIILINAFWLYFIGASHGSFEKSHISGDLITNFIKKEYLKEILEVFQYLIMTVISIIITYWSYNLLLWGIQKSLVTTVLKIPITIPYLSIATGFLLMTVYNIYYLWAISKRLVKKANSAYGSKNS